MDSRCTSCDTIVDPGQAVPYAANPSHAAGYICSQCVGFMVQILAERRKESENRAAGSAITNVVDRVRRPAGLIMSFVDGEARSEFLPEARLMAGPLTKLTPIDNLGKPPVLVLSIPGALRGDPMARDVLTQVGGAALSVGAECFIRSEAGGRHDL